MSAVATLEYKVDELLDVLDRDIKHIQDCLRQLDQLRSCVIKRDDVGLSRMLAEIQAEANSHAANEQKRHSIRKYLAHVLDCSVDKINLSKIEDVLPEHSKAQIAQRKAELRVLVQRLKREHLSTVLLLSECARFNSLLLRNIFGFEDKAVNTYRPDGSTERQANTTFVNLQY
jgi:flagellar biosynthesis/type III secretory pathway chaperone